MGYQVDRLEEQLALFKRLLEGKQVIKGSQTFYAVLGWLKQYPGIMQGEKAILVRQLCCAYFDLTEVEFFEMLRIKPIGEKDGVYDYQTIEDEFDELVPREGWLRNYIEFTRNLESPFAYHLYAGLSGAGAVLNRRVYIDMGGQFRIYPSLGVMLLGPSGVKKTTAGDVIVGLLQEAELVKVYQEKITPEGLVEAMKGEGNAVGLVYAPEMSVFLGKQRYMEGVIPLITRFMDCPASWSSATILRGNSILKNIAISCLFCSTPDWFIKNTPADTFGGGFIARYLLVVQYGTNRRFPIPHPMPVSARVRLLQELAYLHELEGQVTFSPQVYRRTSGAKEEGVYVDWYDQFKSQPRQPEYEVLATYLERKPIHVLRLSMVLHLSTHGSLEICLDCFLRALKLCNASEKFLPSLMQQMFKTTSGEEQEMVLNMIRKNAGVITHTDLVRRLQYKMKAEQTKAVVSSLKEAEMIREVKDNFSRRYILVEEKKDDEEKSV